MSQDSIFQAKLIKRGTVLVPLTEGHLNIYEAWVKCLEEGQEVAVFYEADKNDGTNDQRALIHASIRKIAIESGHLFPEVKLEVKRRSGLVYGEYVKSFADCSKEELGLVIETIKEVGGMFNISF